MSFINTGLSEVLIRSIARLSYSEPTPIQTQAIPVVLRGGDLVARAQTGTGKTAAFGLPILERLLVRGRRAAAARQARALVLAPTRELAIQVERALAAYGAPVHVRTAAIVGGVAMRPQVASLRHGVDVVVATPGRLLDHVQQGTIDLSAVEILTLDEADRLLDMGFLPSLRRILSKLPSARQTLLFSATFSAEVARLAADFTRQPERIDVSGADVATATVRHRIQAVNEGEKSTALTRLLAEAPSGQALVFCKTKRRSDRVGNHLTRAGISAAVIHGNKSQGARNRALGDFKAGRVNVLVATDIAARGLDIAQLPLVVNYDLPLVPTDYVHRAGRTGRAGREGCAVSLVAGPDRDLLPAIQRLLPVSLEHVGAAAGSDLRPVATAREGVGDPGMHRPRPRGEWRRWSGSRPRSNRSR